MERRSTSGAPRDGRVGARQRESASPPRPRRLSIEMDLETDLYCDLLRFWSALAAVLPPRRRSGAPRESSSEEEPQCAARALPPRQTHRPLAKTATNNNAQRRSASTSASGADILCARPLPYPIWSRDGEGPVDADSYFDHQETTRFNILRPRSVLVVLNIAWSDIVLP